MSKEFIEKRFGSASIDLAAKQQEQLAYFTQGKLQDDITQSYLNQWANRNFATSDFFMNYMNTILKNENFLSFFKYHRNPNPSSKLVQTRIKEPLSRVFHAEDSYFNYSIRNKDVDEPQELQDDFESELFEAALFRHNDIIVHDLNDINSPYRFFLSIGKVVSIELEKKDISKIAYSASIGDLKGYAYLDKERFAFFNKDLDEVLSQPHDLKRCPAVFVSNELMGNDPIVRRSMFSHLRGDLETYSILKTLQRMTNFNGVIPVVTKLKTNEKKADGVDRKGLPGEPMTAKSIGGQQSDIHSDNVPSSVMQAGSVIEVPIVKKGAEGGIDTDIVKNLINFFYLPVEASEYLNKLILQEEQNIIISVLGDYSEANESAKNELQVSKSYVSKEDKLRWLSNLMSISRQSSDFIMLALKYGEGSVKCDTFYGSDFFLETQSEIYDMLKNSPNAIERKNLLTRLAQSRNRHNKSKSKKEVILYKLLPYASDEDFKVAVDNMQIEPITFQLQTRFAYWIAMFEASYGSLLTFWEEMEASESEKLILVNNLLTDLINSSINIKEVQNGKEASSTPASV